MSLPQLPPEDASAAWPKLAIPQAMRSDIVAGRFTPSNPVPPVGVIAQSAPTGTPPRGNAPPRSQPRGHTPRSSSPPAAQAVARRVRRTPGMLSAIPKGALLGLAVFAIRYGFVPFWPYWQVNWHWAWLGGGLAILAVLVGLDLALIAGVGAALWVSRITLLHHPSQFLMYLGIGVVLRCVYELLP